MRKLYHSQLSKAFKELKKMEKRRDHRGYYKVHRRIMRIRKRIHQPDDT